MIFSSNFTQTGTACSVSGCKGWTQGLFSSIADDGAIVNGLLHVVLLCNVSKFNFSLYVRVMYIQSIRLIFALQLNYIAEIVQDSQLFTCLPKLLMVSRTTQVHCSFIQSLPTPLSLSVVMDSIYFHPFRTTFQNIAYVQSVINETVRCSKGKIPVYAFHLGQG